MSWNTMKRITLAVLFCLCSCYTVPSNNELLDYSDATSLDTVIYRIEIDIFNKNLTLLKQNVKNEIAQNNGKIENELMENLNQYRLSISIPRQNTQNFMQKIKSFGYVTNERKEANDMDKYLQDIKSQHQTSKDLLEKYNTMLKSAVAVNDIISLEREIKMLNTELKMSATRIREMEQGFEKTNIILLLWNR